ncbi:MAG TPA: ABC transporter ATP-binding protein [Burkholderiales bacterium]
MTELLIEASGLHTFYGSSHVLQGVSLRLHRGESLGLMGRNGMGKTTLLKSILGLVRPRQGSVMLKGRDVTREAPHRIARSGVAYVPEGRGIFPNLSVRENLVMAARPGPWTFERVLEIFPRLGARLQHGGGQLSGGEQQMLTIGRALMTNPELLILDEATEGLAPRIAQDIWRIVRRVRESGIATVIVDKNFKAVNAVTDRNLILVKGQIVFEGSAAELLARPEVRAAHLGV